MMADIKAEDDFRIVRPARTIAKLLRIYRQRVVEIKAKIEEQLPCHRHGDGGGRASEEARVFESAITRECCAYVRNLIFHDMVRLNVSVAAVDAFLSNAVRYEFKYVKTDEDGWPISSRAIVERMFFSACINSEVPYFGPNPRRS